MRGTYLFHDVRVQQNNEHVVEHEGLFKVPSLSVCVKERHAGIMHIQAQCAAAIRCHSCAAIRRHSVFSAGLGCHLLSVILLAACCQCVQCM